MSQYADDNGRLDDIVRKAPIGEWSARSGIPVEECQEWNTSRGVQEWNTRSGIPVEECQEWNTRSGKLGVEYQ